MNVGDEYASFGEQSTSNRHVLKQASTYRLSFPSKLPLASSFQHLIMCPEELVMVKKPSSKKELGRTTETAQVDEQDIPRNRSSSRLAGLNQCGPESMTCSAKCGGKAHTLSAPPSRHDISLKQGMTGVPPCEVSQRMRPSRVASSHRGGLRDNCHIKVQSGETNKPTDRTIAGRTDERCRLKLVLVQILVDFYMLCFAPSIKPQGA